MIAHKILGYTMLAIFVVALLLTGACVIVEYTFTNSNVVKYQNVNIKPALRANVAVKQSAAKPITTIFPISWDDYEGAYMINAKIGNSWVPMVLDSASCITSAKSATCTWQQCEGCEVTDCPCHATINNSSKSCFNESI